MRKLFEVSTVVRTYQVMSCLLKEPVAVGATGTMPLSPQLEVLKLWRGMMKVCIAMAT